MIKKIFSLLSFVIISLLPQASYAQLTDTVPDNIVIGVACNSTEVCLTPIDIKKITYGSGKSFCNGYISGNCNLNNDGGFYGTDAMAVLQASLDDMIALSASNATEKLTGYTDCVLDSVDNGNAKCKTISAILTSSGWVYSTWPSYNVASFTKSNPVSCPYSGIYVKGSGCAVTNTTIGSVTYNSQRSFVAGPTSNQSCKEPEVQQAEKQASCKVGNPVDINTGAKIDTVADLTFHVPFIRTYSSRRSQSGTLGQDWRHQYDKSLSFAIESEAGINVVLGLNFTLENSEEVFFNREASTDPFTPAFSDQKGYSVSISGTDYVLHAPNGNKEYYSATGKLIQMVRRDGYTYNLAYTSGQLSTVTDSYGKTLTFTYSSGSISNVTSSNGDYMDYTYTSGLLTQAKFNNIEILAYGYTSNLLTSKTDAKGNTYALYTYDSSGRVTEAKHVYAPSSYNDTHSYAYTNNNVVVTLPDSSTSSYDTGVDIFRSKTTSTSISGGKNISTLYYDNNGNVSSFYDGINSGIYTYDSGTNLLDTSMYKGITKVYTWNNTTRQISSYVESTTDYTRTYSFT